MHIQLRALFAAKNRVTSFLQGFYSTLFELFLENSYIHTEQSTHMMVKFAKTVKLEVFYVVHYLVIGFKINYRRNIAKSRSTKIIPKFDWATNKSEPCLVEHVYDVTVIPRNKDDWIDEIVSHVVPTLARIHTTSKVCLDSR